MDPAQPSTFDQPVDTELSEDAASKMTMNPDFKENHFVTCPPQDLLSNSTKISSTQAVASNEKQLSTSATSDVPTLPTDYITTCPTLSENKQLFSATQAAYMQPNTDLQRAIIPRTLQETVGSGSNITVEHHVTDKTSQSSLLPPENGKTAVCDIAAKKSIEAYNPLSCTLADLPAIFDHNSSQNMQCNAQIAAKDDKPDDITHPAPDNSTPFTLSREITNNDARIAIQIACTAKTDAKDDQTILTNNGSLDIVSENSFENKESLTLSNPGQAMSLPATDVSTSLNSASTLNDIIKTDRGVDRVAIPSFDSSQTTSVFQDISRLSLWPVSLQSSDGVVYTETRTRPYSPDADSVAHTNLQSDGSSLLSNDVSLFSASRTPEWQYYSVNPEQSSSGTILIQLESHNSPTRNCQEKVVIPVCDQEQSITQSETEDIFRAFELPPSSPSSLPSSSPGPGLFSSSPPCTSSPSSFHDLDVAHSESFKLSDQDMEPVEEVESRRAEGLENDSADQKKRKRDKIDQDPPHGPPTTRRLTTASQRVQFKKLTTPFRSPVVDPVKAASGTGKTGLPKASHVTDQVKDSPEEAEAKQSAVSEKIKVKEKQAQDDSKILHRTARASLQFKSPLLGVSPNYGQPAIRLTPTIQGLERKLQILKRAVKVKKCEEETELQALIKQWKEAAREVAWSVWEVHKERGQNIDGGWEGKIAFEGQWGWDDGTNHDRNNVQQRLRPQDTGEGDEAELRNDMGTMLGQLGIDPSILGWDCEQDCFVGE